MPIKSLTFWIFALYLALNAIDDMAAWAVAILWVGWRTMQRRDVIALPRSLLRVCLVPTLLVLIAMPGALFHPIHDVARDLWYLTNPIVAIAFGYFLFEQIGSWQAFIQPMIAAGLIASIYSAISDVLHWQLILLSTSVDAVHQVAGYGFGQAMVPIILILLTRKVGLAAGFLDRHKAVRIALYTTGSLAIFISFSRTLILVLLVGFLFCVPYQSLRARVLRSRGLGVIGLGSLLVAAVVVAAWSLPTLSTSFLNKVANTTDEVKFRHYESYQEISDNWRGYEAYRAIRTYDTFSPREKAMGGGLGALVDLGFSMQLTPTESMRYIPITHNGYTYLLVKVGVAGLALFAVFVFQIGRWGVRMVRQADPTRVFVGYLLLWTAIDFVLTQSVITGIYNRSALATNLILVGAAFASLRHEDALIAMRCDFTSIAPDDFGAPAIAAYSSREPVHQ